MPSGRIVDVIAGCAGATPEPYLALIRDLTFHVNLARKFETMDRQKLALDVWIARIELLEGCFELLHYEGKTLLAEFVFFALCKGLADFWDRDVESDI